MLLLTEKEPKSHQESTVCYICRKNSHKILIQTKSYLKVRDRYHFTGKYRAAAHSICNLRFNVPSEIPVIFLSGSDYAYKLYHKGISKQAERSV